MKRDLIGYTFKDMDNVGYKYKMKRKMTIEDCLQNCCQHDNCHVALFQQQVCTIFLKEFNVLNSLLIDFIFKEDICFWNSKAFLFLSIHQICYLVQCKEKKVCEEVTRTNKKSRLIYLNKTTVEKEKFCPQQNSGGIIWEKTPAMLTSEQPCPRDAVGKNDQSFSISYT